MPEPSAPRDNPIAPPSRRELVRGYLGELFDIQFNTLLTTRMMPGVYSLGIGLSALFTAYLVYRGFKNSTWEGVVWLVLLGPAAFIGLVTALRITLEFVLAMFRIAWHIEHVAGSTQELSHNMPRFGFWRTLLYGEKAGAPPRKVEPGKEKSGR